MYVGASGLVAEAQELCRVYAMVNRPVVLVGPVGCGKTTFARYLHQASGRTGEFVELSAGELSDTLFHDTLFGHARGAYTGAVGQRVGAYQRAANGTLLIDDIAYLESAVQTTILRAVESRSVLPLGSAREVPVTCREVYATTVHPDDLVAEKRLLPDLRSRLGELVIEIPPLAMRSTDILPLAQWFIEKFDCEHGPPRGFQLSAPVQSVFCRYPWPLNLRELKAVSERSVVHAGMDDRTTVLLRDLPHRFFPYDEGNDPPYQRLTPELVRHAVGQAAGNQMEAARQLGVHRNTVARYLKQKV